MQCYQWHIWIQYHYTYVTNNYYHIIIAVSFSFTAPTEPPHKVKISKITSQSITVRWKSITCKKHNGVPVTYEVQFGPLGGVIMTKRVTSRSFFSNGLTPSTSYIFRVCGYYGERHGPFSDFINITTLHESKF